MMARAKVLVSSCVVVCGLGCASPADETSTLRYRYADAGIDEDQADAGASFVSPDTPDESTPDVSRDYDASDASASNVPDASVPDNNGGTCESFRVLSEGTTARVLLLMDASGSMAGFWPSATASVGRVVDTLGANMSFGVGHFGHNGCDDAAFPVAPALNQASAIKSALATVKNQGATPTAHALSRVADFKSGQVNPVTGTSMKDIDAVVLVTDGLPNCNYANNGATCDCTLGAGPGACTSYPELCSDADRALGGIQRLRDLGVETFVIGFNTAGVPLSEQTLGAMANTGSAHGEYYTANNATELESKLRAASTRIRTCDYVLASEPEDPDYVRVTFEGTDIPQRSVSPQGGWSLRGKTITLNGADCDRVRAATNPDLVITVECEPVEVR